jgi:IclR family acetate operon transcriptional repressor
MLATLQRHGIVAFDETAQLWYIGAECFRIGAAFLRRRKIAEHGREVMQALVADSGETANLAVAEEDGVVFVSQVETHEPIRAFFRPGTRAPFHASGVGKAILAYLPAGRVAALLDRLTLDRFTEHTITDRATLTGDLARTRARGWALDDEERYPGMRCVAAPIFNEFGEPIAGLSLSGPTVRMTRATVAALGPVVRDAAAAITRSIGGTVPAQK